MSAYVYVSIFLYEWEEMCREAFWSMLPLKTKKLLKVVVKELVTYVSLFIIYSLLCCSKPVWSYFFCEEESILVITVVNLNHKNIVVSWNSIILK